MSLSTDHSAGNGLKTSSKGGSFALKLTLGAVVLAFVAAVVLWLRFGPSVFVSALTAAWTCL